MCNPPSIPFINTRSDLNNPEGIGSNSLASTNLLLLIDTFSGDSGAFINTDLEKSFNSAFAPPVVPRCSTLYLGTPSVIFLLFEIFSLFS